MCVASAILAGCSSDADELSADTGKSTKINIDVAVEVADGSIDTRAEESPVLGGMGQGFGVFICKQGTINAQYSPRSINMNGWPSNGTFRYAFESGTTNFSNIYLLGDPKDDSNGGTYIPKADFYAYSPYISGTRDLTNIPFAVSSQMDMMWALQNDNSHTESSLNRNIVPDGNDKTIKLTFRHVMAKINFCFQQLSNIPDLRISTIGISTPNPETMPLYTSASMNAITGELFNLKHTATSKEKISRSWSLDDRYGPFYIDQTYGSNSWNYASFLIVPSMVPATMTDDNDVVYNVDFAIWGIPYKRFQILRKHVKNPDGTYGFKRGRQYNFYFTIDDQLHLQGITIDSRWHDAANIEIPI